MKALSELKKLCEKATPGKMVAEEHHYRWDITNGHYMPKQRLFYAEGLSKEDAELFIAARTAMPILIEVIEKQRDLIWRAKIPNTRWGWWLNDAAETAEQTDALLAKLGEK